MRPHKRIGARIVIGHRLFFGLLPAAVGKPLSSSDLASVESFARGKPLPTVVDLTTRGQRHAASIEEYFAIDDDADQYAKWPAQAVPVTPAFTLVVELQPFVYSAVAPNHSPRAAPSTGPPHA